MVVRWLFAVEKDVIGLVRSKQALQAAIRGGGRVVLVVNTRSRKGRRHWPGLSARLAAAGLPVEVAQAVPHRLKRVLGRGAYTLTAARRLASHQAFKATLRVDGAEQVVWTHQLNVANGGYHAGRRIARDAGVDDRLLVVYR